MHLIGVSLRRRRCFEHFGRMGAFCLGTWFVVVVALGSVVVVGLGSAVVVAPAEDTQWFKTRNIYRVSVYILYRVSVTRSRGFGYFWRIKY